MHHLTHHEQIQLETGNLPSLGRTYHQTVFVFQVIPYFTFGSFHGDHEIEVFLILTHHCVLPQCPDYGMLVGNDTIAAIRVGILFHYRKNAYLFCYFILVEAHNHVMGLGQRDIMRIDNLHTRVYIYILLCCKVTEKACKEQRILED